MSDAFESCPPGSIEKLKQYDELAAYARRASDALAKMAAGGRFELQTVEVAGELYANVLFCEARVETRIRNARQHLMGKR
jgi:hypothetical protein